MINYHLLKINYKNKYNYKMDKNLFTKDKHLLVTGANSIALVVLAGYMAKKLNEKDMELEELRVEFSNLNKIVKERDIRLQNLVRNIKLEQENNNNKNVNMLREMENKISKPRIVMSERNERNERTERIKEEDENDERENLIQFDNDDEINNEQDVLNILRS